MLKLLYNKSFSELWLTVDGPRQTGGGGDKSPEKQGGDPAGEPGGGEGGEAPGLCGESRVDEDKVISHMIIRYTVTAI